MVTCYQTTGNGAVFYLDGNAIAKLKLQTSFLVKTLQQKPTVYCHDQAFTSQL